MAVHVRRGLAGERAGRITEQVTASLISAGVQQATRHLRLDERAVLDVLRERRASDDAHCELWKNERIARNSPGSLLQATFQRPAAPGKAPSGQTLHSQMSRSRDRSPSPTPSAMGLSAPLTLSRS